MGTIIQAFPDGGSGGGGGNAEAMIASTFSTSSEYSAGDLVIYEGTLYKFTTDYGPGNWDPTKVTTTIVDDELQDKQTKILVTPLVINGDNETTVEGALGALNDTFTGTQNDWDTLALSQKLQYKFVNITDDSGVDETVVDTVQDGNMHAVTSNAVHDAIDNAISNLYTPSGSKTVAEMVSTLLVAGNLGNVYNMTDAGTTTSDFVEGQGKPINIGDNVAIVNAGTSEIPSYKFDLLAGFVDITGKADKPSSSTSGNLASLDGNGNLADSGWKSDKTTTAVSGNPISISGLKSNQLAVNPIITLEPIQAGSGDPSPNNIRAISGYDKIEVLSCGVNVWDEVWELGDLNAQGQNVSSTTKIRSKNYIPIVGGSTYYLKLSSESALVFICFYDVNKTFISSNNQYQGTFTVPLMARYCRFNCPVIYGTTYNNDIGINYPATQTSYVSSNKTTDLSLQIRQTIYGGTLDVEKGILTVDRGCKTFNGSEEGWIHSSSWTAPNVMANPNLLSDAVPVSGYWAEANITSNQGIVNMPGVIVTQNISGRIGQGDGTVLYVDLGVSQSDFVTYLTSHPLQIVYPLATPIAIQLTPHEISLLKDYAYVSTNGTSISLDYHNGELASLADVSQLGETVNELGGGISEFNSKIEQLIPDNASSSNKLVTETDNNFKFQGVSSGTDLNNITIPGVYTVGVSNYTSQHAPDGNGWYTLYVTRANGDPNYITQIAIYQNNNKTSTRACNNTSWGNWNRLAMTSEIAIPNPFGSSLNGNVEAFSNKGTLFLYYVEDSGSPHYLHFQPRGGYSDCSFTAYSRYDILQCLYRSNSDASIGIMGGRSVINDTTIDASQWYKSSSKNIVTFTLGNWNTYMIIGHITGQGATVWIDTNPET